MNLDTKEILLSYLSTPEEERGALTPKQGETLLRVIRVIALFDNHRVEKHVVDLHMALMKEMGTPISRATAYRDLETAKYIQGDVMKINKKFERWSAGEWIKEAMTKCMAVDDFRSFFAGAAILAKTYEFDKRDTVDIDYRTLRPVRPIFGFFPDLFSDVELPETEEELQREIEALKSPAKFRKTGEYVDFEDIDERTDEESTS